MAGEPHELVPRGRGLDAGLHGGGRGEDERPLGVTSPKGGEDDGEDGESVKDEEGGEDGPEVWGAWRQISAVAEEDLKKRRCTGVLHCRHSVPHIAYSTSSPGPSLASCGHS